VKAVGDFDFSQETVAVAPSVTGELERDEMTEFEKDSSVTKESLKEELNSVDVDIASYRPKIQGREWIISETDLAWITIGCYILGTGGGGSPYGHMLRLREIMRNGGVVRVISPDDLQDDDLVACGGGKGSPTVSMEKLAGDEYVLYSYADFYETSLKVKQDDAITDRALQLHESSTKRSNRTGNRRWQWSPRDDPGCIDKHEYPHSRR
jgi:hypothetical protein